MSASTVSFEFFDGLDLRVFYRALDGGLAQAVRAAVRREDGWKVEAIEEEGDTLRVRFRNGSEAFEFELPAGEIPRAWEWWTPPPLRRSFVIMWEGGIIEGPLVTDAEVYCDICGDPIGFRPVPLLLGSYALCAPCFQDATGVPLADAASMDRVQLIYVEDIED